MSQITYCPLWKGYIDNTWTIWKIQKNILLIYCQYDPFKISNKQNNKIDNVITIGFKYRSVECVNEPGQVSKSSSRNEPWPSVRDNESGPAFAESESDGRRDAGAPAVHVTSAPTQLPGADDQAEPKTQTASDTKQAVVVATEASEHQLSAGERVAHAGLSRVGAVWARGCASHRSRTHELRAGRRDGSRRSSPAKSRTQWLQAPAVTAQTTHSPNSQLWQRWRWLVLAKVASYATTTTTTTTKPFLSLS